MFQRILKDPFSSSMIVIIILGYFFTYFFEKTSALPLLNFILYFFIFLLGIESLRKTLLLYFPDFTVGLTILSLAFGTNLFNLIAFDYKLQPILLFSLYSILVYISASWQEIQKVIQLIFLALILGLIILFQPTGYLALLIPMLWGVHNKESWMAKVNMLKKSKKQLLLFTGVLFLIILIPMVIWKISPGEIPLFSFKLPGVFISFSSFLWEDSFSFEHGWLIYTPLMIVSFVGFYFLAEKGRNFFYSIFLICFLDLFLESSWNDLGNAPIFGQIAFIPAYALFVLPLAFILNFIQKGNIISRIMIAIFIPLLIILNLFQTWQFNNGILLKTNMTPDKYGLIFGRSSLTEIEKQQLKGVEPDECFQFQNENKFKKVVLSSFDFEDSNVPYNSDLERAFVKNGKQAFAMTSNARFSPLLRTFYKELKKGSSEGVRITVSVFAPVLSSLNDVNLVVSSLHKNSNYLYKRRNLGELNLKPGIWNTVSLDYQIPTDPNPEDEIVAYVWYTGNSVIYIDDLKYEAFERKK